MGNQHRKQQVKARGKNIHPFLKMNPFPMKNAFVNDKRRTHVLFTNFSNRNPKICGEKWGDVVDYKKRWR
ncbi:hypothetical protein HHA03_02150 [Halolactibacillus halophilus]|uniref:Uncharacterized protein n=1 Tax=Halolactibacillus halophilus TaxID=306540 RepID=A0ABQ0VHW7_9BACI|nr:hypothetical protein HHA03_02150 [Halolactibacillus halophilus]